VLKRLLVPVLAPVLALAALALAVPAEAAAPTGTVRATVIRWSDGDTVVTSRGKVRLIGVDTPELGTCGSAAAQRLAQRVAPVGSTVRLTSAASVDDRDRYGRMLRYVSRGGVDVGLRQLQRRQALARYDGLDGYDTHPKQARYRSVSRAKGTACPSWVEPRPVRGTTTTTTSTSQTSYAPINGGTACPPNAQIKGNRDSMIYHLPGQQYYGVTHPEECFATEAAAIAAGYRKSKV
jgi:endonuclease YncB( thermonuclease family)